MSDHLRDLVAAALRGDGQWDSLSESQKAVWRADADRAIKALRSAARTGPDVAPMMRSLSNEEMQALCDRGPGEIIPVASSATEARLREAVLASIDMIENCADAPKNPDSLPEMVKVHLQQAISAAPAGESVTGWQPIETAPKDHFPVLVWSEEFGRCVAFRDVTWTWWPLPITAHHEPLEETPTHWMPLSPSPTRKSEARS
jgi:hypothetical protein